MDSLKLQLVILTFLALASAKLSQHPVVLVVSYDGFRFDYFNKTDTPAMKALREAGVSTPYMEAVFPTKTFVNHQSIATGVYAETHGVIDNDIYDPLYNATLRGRDLTDTRFWRYNDAIMPIWIHNEMAGEGRASGTHMWAGSTMPYGADRHLPKYYYPGYTTDMSWEDRVNDVISWLTNSTQPANLVFLYFNQPDGVSHDFGPNDPRTIAEIRRADNNTAFLIEKLKEAGIFEDINLIMLSDHGMTEVVPSRVVNMTAIIDRSLVEREHGGSPVKQLMAKAGQGDRLYASLVESSRTNNFSVYKKEEMRDPSFYTNSRRIMDYVIVADDGYVFDDFRFTGAAAGLHGYSNQAESMRAYFTAHGPAFKKNYKHGPIKNIDVVPLISHILGIQSPPSNGSLARVIDMVEPGWSKLIV